MLHPTGPDLILPPAADELSLDFDLEDVTKVLKSFPPGSGAGPSGLKPVHLLEALDSPSKTGVVSALLAFASSFSTDAFPSATRDLLCAASIFAIPKKCGRVRPIAVGELCVVWSPSCWC